MIFVLKYFRQVWLGAPIVILSCHYALRAAFGKVDVHSKLASLLNMMEEYLFESCRLVERMNVNTDHLLMSSTFFDGAAINDLITKRILVGTQSRKSPVAEETNTIRVEISNIDYLDVYEPQLEEVRELFFKLTATACHSKQVSVPRATPRLAYSRCVAQKTGYVWSLQYQKRKYFIAT